MFGTRFSLLISIVSVMSAVVVGGAIGLLSGWRGGAVDWLLMRATDALLAFPGLLLAFGIVGVLGAGTKNVAIALAVIFVPIFIRLVRVQVLIVKEELFVEAAQTSGVPPWKIVRHHIIPNIAGPTTIQALSTLGLALISEGALSYLGLSVQPPGTSLGTLLQDGFTVIAQTPRLILIPGLVITVLCWSFNAIADALRLGLNPRSGTES
jgi:peptide/nickel transport system permease protein